MSNTKSAKRAAAVERLKSLDPMDTSATRYIRAILGSVAGMTAQDVTRELIDLLTDEQQDSSWICPDAREQVSNISKKSQDSEIDEPDTIRNELEDNGYVVMPYHNGEKPAKLIGKQFDQLIYDELHDSREKLETDIWAGCDHLTMLERGDVLVNVPSSRLLGWLDRQAAITERECFERAAKSDWLGQHLYAIMAENRELQAKVDKLYQSCDILRDKKLIAEREKSKLQAYMKELNVRLEIGKQHEK